MKPNLSIVIPVYNSQQSLPLLISQLLEQLPKIASRYEIILVNDGSQDTSWSEIEKACQKRKMIQGIDLVQNYGQHNALLCGIRAARYETIVTLDDDLQHPPAEIPKLLKKLESGFDIVYGTPNRGSHELWRNISSLLVKWAFRVTIRIPYAEKISAFRAFRTSLRDKFQNYSNPYVSIDVLLSWGSTKIGFVDTNHTERKIGQSQYTFYKLIRHALNMMLGFSVLPLRLASIIGFIFTLFGILVLAYILIKYFLQGGSVVPGFPFLASIFSIFSGIQLFVLGIIGEYLARMYTNLMTKPPYIIYRQI